MTEDQLYALSVALYHLDAAKRLVLDAGIATPPSTALTGIRNIEQAKSALDLVYLTELRSQRNAPK